MVLMIVSGTSKRMLAWKRTPHRRCECLQARRAPTAAAGTDAYQPLSDRPGACRRRRTRASTATQHAREAEHRVQVELGDLGEVEREPGQAVQHVGERLGIGGGRAAEAARPAGRPCRSSRAPRRRRRSAARSRSACRRSARPARRRGRRRRAGRTPGPATTPASSSTPPVRYCSTSTGVPMRSTASLTWTSSRRSRTTPPTSVLCTPGAAVLTTAGKPSSFAAVDRLLGACRRCAAGRAGRRRPRAARACGRRRGRGRRRRAARRRRCAARASGSMPSGSGTVPCGRRSHSARWAANASARAADSGYGSAATAPPVRVAPPACPRR